MDVEAELHHIVGAAKVLVEERRCRRRIERRVLPPAVVIFGEQRHRASEILQEAGLEGEADAEGATGDGPARRTGHRQEVDVQGLVEDG